MPPSPDEVLTITPGSPEAIIRGTNAITPLATPKTFTLKHQIQSLASCSQAPAVRSTLRAGLPHGDVLQIREGGAGHGHQFGTGLRNGAGVEGRLRVVLDRQLDELGDLWSREISGERQGHVDASRHARRGD